jgi:glycosyltransferase involved in cell wall biosynthesis
MLEERVRVVESASSEDLCGAYTQASALVLASTYEGLPTVILEAMYFGCPVVASAVGGIPYVLENESFGLTYPLRDQEEYVSSVRAVLRRSRDSFSRGRDAVCAKYSWEMNAAKIAAVYGEISVGDHHSRASGYTT